MELFKKYEFNSKEQAETKIAALPHTTDDLTGESYLEGGHTIVHLGHLWITEPTYDADGEVETEGVASDKYSVDVLWQGLESSPYGWASYEVEPEGNGVHTFAGRNF
ncbi:MAG: hypothetical protein ACYS26_21710 [Planctomycetota bacterium]|jgi:hypothetical protein